MEPPIPATKSDDEQDEEDEEDKEDSGIMQDCMNEDD